MELDLNNLLKLKDLTQDVLDKYFQDLEEHKQKWIRPFSSELKRWKKQDIFIETGTATGASIQAALDAGFSHVYSIELNPYFCLAAQEYFKECPVTIISGSSHIELPKLLKTDGVSNQAIFLWLDAHFSGGPHVGDNMISYLPFEIETLKRSEVDFSNISILIDDFDHMEKQGLDDFIEESKQALKLLKPHCEPELYKSATGHTFMKAL